MSATAPRRFHLCTVERATDISSPPVTTLGTLCLTRLQDFFYFHWNPLEASATHRVSPVFQDSKITKDDCWDASRGFVFECKDADLL
jgi:hypothetical protein